MSETTAQRVLVLGGHGFIGKSLVLGLKLSGYEVDAPTHKELDVRNMTGIDVTGYSRCYNLASTTHNYHILTDPYYDIDVNCNGAVSVLEQFRKHNPKCFQIYVSTFFVNGGQPKALYGATKLCAEHIYRTYMNVYDIPVCVVRLPNVYGPGEKGTNKKGSLNWFIERAVKGDTPIQYYGGDACREFAYIDDVVEYLVTLESTQQTLTIPGYPMLMGDFIKLIDPTAVTTDMPDFHKRIGLKDYKCGWHWTEGQIDPVEGIRRTKEYYAKLQ